MERVICMRKSKGRLYVDIDYDDGLTTYTLKDNECRECFDELLTIEVHDGNFKYPAEKWYHHTVKEFINELLERARGWNGYNEVPEQYIKDFYNPPMKKYYYPNDEWVCQNQDKCHECDYWLSIFSKCTFRSIEEREELEEELKETEKMEELKCYKS